jgi:hypothetical protein
MDFRDAACAASELLDDSSYCVPVAGGTLGRLAAWWRVACGTGALLVVACLAYPLAIDDPIALVIAELTTIAMMAGIRHGFLRGRSAFLWRRLAARVASHGKSRVVFVAITITNHDRRDEDVAIGTFDIDRYSVAIEGLRYRYQIQRRDLISFRREQTRFGRAGVLRYRIGDRELALVFTYLSPRRGRVFESAAALALCPDRLADRTYARAPAPHAPADDRAARRIARFRWRVAAAVIAANLLGAIVMGFLEETPAALFGAVPLCATIPLLRWRERTWQRLVSRRFGAGIAVAIQDPRRVVADDFGVARISPAGVAIDALTQRYVIARRDVFSVQLQAMPRHGLALVVRYHAADRELAIAITCASAERAQLTSALAG